MNVLHNALIENTVAWLQKNPDALEVYQTCKKCSAKFDIRPIVKNSFDEIQSEYKLLDSRYRADIALLKDCSLKGIIEIKNTSPISKKKWDFIKINNIPCIEIDANFLLKNETRFRVIRSHIPRRFVRHICDYCDKPSTPPLLGNYNLKTQQFLASIRPKC